MAYIPGACLVYGWEINIDHFNKWLKQNNYVLNILDEIIVKNYDYDSDDDGYNPSTPTYANIPKCVKIIYSPYGYIDNIRFEEKVAISLYDQSECRLEELLNISSKYINKAKSFANKITSDILGEPRLFSMLTIYKEY